MWLVVGNRCYLCNWKNIYSSLDGVVGSVVGCSEDTGGVAIVIKLWLARFDMSIGEVLMSI